VRTVRDVCDWFHQRRIILAAVKQFTCLGLDWSYQAARVIREIIFAVRLAQTFDAVRIFSRATVEPPSRFR
jgi:hypothetical protein